MYRREFTSAFLTFAASAAFGSVRAFAQTARPVVCTIVKDAWSGKTLLREGPCTDRYSPCSSFKFPIAVMGFDAGILTGPHSPAIQYLPEFENAYDPPTAHKDADPSVWLRDSIVWYSQQMTRKLGKERFASYVKQFRYGNEDVAGTSAEDGLTHAWLMNSLAISADEQVGFVSDFLNERLGVSSNAYRLTRETLPSYPGEGGWTIRGKSGSGWLRNEAGQIDKSRPQGWFVGWGERQGRTVAFARLQVGTEPSSTPGGTLARNFILQNLSTLANG
ncbi:putative beta-lactamase [Caenibius tardaugens NBRC 16725]|jgi:beta-lactamase class D|uniref:Putative beta-lactamase n=2 Tax=Caenibius TaxID=2827482 RepID=U2YAU8_9SPHN|nr:putative beta-lactamase [Caenibius tardaugens NBRC 16725]